MADKAQQEVGMCLPSRFDRNGFDFINKVKVVVDKEGIEQADTVAQTEHFYGVWAFHLKFNVDEFGIISQFDINVFLEVQETHLGEAKC